ncbi:MAG: RNA polymerase sigma factor [Phenylobacterium sp.]
MAGHRLRLFRFILKQVGDVAHAEDLAQRTLLTALEAQGGFRGESSLTSWLFGIALNKVRDHRRAQRRDLRLDGEDVLAGLADEGDDPATAFARDEQRRRVRAAVDSLPDEMRELVVLVSLEGLSYDQAAAVADVPVGTVRSRLHRAKALLRERLASNEAGPQDTQPMETPSRARPAARTGSDRDGT